MGKALWLDFFLRQYYVKWGKPGTEATCCLTPKSTCNEDNIWGTGPEVTAGINCKGVGGWFGTAGREGSLIAVAATSL